MMMMIAVQEETAHNRRVVPRITTRGCYNLYTGEPVDRAVTYRMCPRRYSDVITGGGIDELAIMIHGFRNNDCGARDKAVIAQERLRLLGYGHPVIGFSYDTNTKGAYTKKHYKEALATGYTIAVANGRHLADFLVWAKTKRDDIMVRLLGHSLGSEVIHAAVMHLARMDDTAGIIESVHLFGASLPADIQDRLEVRGAMDHIIRGTIVNYYSPTDEVLSEEAVSDDHTTAMAGDPIGLNGAVRGKWSPRYVQHMVAPENHRFASYAAVLQSFP